MGELANGVELLGRRVEVGEQVEILGKGARILHSTNVEHFQCAREVKQTEPEKQ